MSVVHEAIACTFLMTKTIDRVSDISRGRGPAKFRYFREIPRNSQKNAKYREIRQKYFADPRNSGISAKSREIPKKTRNTAKSARNISDYMSAKHI